MKAIKRVCLFAGVMVATICAPAAQPRLLRRPKQKFEPWRPQSLWTSGASPLSTYNRHYAVVVQDSSRHILGVHFDNGGKIVFTTPERLPRVLDGGCGVVNVEYDVTAKRFLAVTCDGEA